MTEKSKYPKGKWARHGPRPKFLTACVNDQELNTAHVIAKSMNLSMSAMLRRLLVDQYYRLAVGEYKPVPEQTIDLSEVE